MRPTTFDDIPGLLQTLAEESAEALSDLSRLLAVRDLWGRVRFLVPTRPEPNSRLEAALQGLARRAAKVLGAHSHPLERAILFQDELAAEAGELAGPPSLLLSTGPPEWWLVDRQVTGLSWGTVAEERGDRPQEAQRLAFYSLKGGVGRSTATAVAGWHLARAGRNVLVVDLDLEAPGLSTSLLSQERQPEFGIVDWLVEDAVGQGDAVLPAMVASSPLANDLPGNLWVVPSHGQQPGEYVAKLGRCYVDQNDARGHEAWMRRMVRLLGDLEEARHPDVVLVDTRAGLSDLAAVGVTELGAEILLFAIGTAQTWTAYRLLFDHWKRTEAVRRLRERLQVVAGLVPETERQVYLTDFQEESWSLFLETVYDPAGADDLDSFSFDLDDTAAPHHPIPIYWHRGLSTLRSFESLDPQLVEAAFGRFLGRLDQILGRSEDAP